MEITEVKIVPVREEKLKGFVSIVFDHCFMVNDIKLIQGRDGLFVSMPSRRKKNGEFKDVAHPLNSETRRRIEERILAEFEKLPNGGAVVRRLTTDGAEAAPPAETASAPPIQVERSLAEVEEYHLSDSFWTVS